MFGAQHHDDVSQRHAKRASCARCQSTERLVTGDGPTVCWPCALAWGSFAALVTGGPTSVEPVMVSVCRTGHHRPRPGCAWCLGRLTDRNGSEAPDPRGRRGPAA